MMEPDEDEDQTRLCSRCARRPRWSRHAGCKFCIQCGGRSVIKSLKHRKGGTSRKVEPKPWVAARRVRYYELRALGVRSAEALILSGNSAKHAAAVQALTKR